MYSLLVSFCLDFLAQSFHQFHQSLDTLNNCEHSINYVYLLLFLSKRVIPFPHFLEIQYFDDIEISQFLLYNLFRIFSWD